MDDDDRQTNIKKTIVAYLSMGSVTLKLVVTDECYRLSMEMCFISGMEYSTRLIFSCISFAFHS